jgi:hypothetical protein
LVVIVYLIFKYAIPYIKNNFLNKGVKWHHNYKRYTQTKN